MLKRCLSPLTLVNQLALIVLLLALLGVAGMGLAGWLGQGIQGSAHAINKAGTLRMQSYRLLAAIPLTAQESELLDEMSRTAASAELTRAARRDDQIQQLNALRDYWQEVLAPAIAAARTRSEVSDKVAAYVGHIDRLVTSFDHTTELRIGHIIMLQQAMTVLMGLLLIFTVIWLRKRLLRPWRQLMTMANAIGQRDFRQRAQIPGRDEMATLGHALNSMSAELAESYASLEQRVADKTAGLARTNEALSFLYSANRRLHSQAPFCHRVMPVLNELQQLTPLREIELRVYECGSEENYQEFTWRANADCPESGCDACPTLAPLPAGECTTLKWRLLDNHTQYGLVLAKLPLGENLSRDRQQLVDTLMEQLTTTLALERHSERQQQLVVMEERSAIARELHDSIAQSLSCMKIQVSCLQMQGDTLTQPTRDLLAQIRGELNTSWRQLRELLTTFRLKLTEPGLRPALEASCQEFSARLGFAVELIYQLPPRCVPGHQAIHLVQIAREALNNTLKHAGATAAGVCATQHGKQVRMIIWDNGRGITGSGEKSNHYGLVIMRDRAHSLKGDCQIRSRPGGGTEVVVNFIPAASTPSHNRSEK
jgi:two-component system nitrate/nitrite sensor histidine kinase NarX